MTYAQTVGDITTARRGIIVHQVNAQGVMNGGVAKVIREKWPQVFQDYARIIGPEYTQPHSGLPFMGRVIWSNVEEDIVVASVVGQQFFGREEGRRYTSYDALDAGFREVADIAKDIEAEVHYPLIGCGLGGGNWTIVSSIINAHLDTIDHRLWIPPGDGWWTKVGLP